MHLFLWKTEYIRMMKQAEMNWSIILVYSQTHVTLFSSLHKTDSGIKTCQQKNETDQIWHQDLHFTRKHLKKKASATQT